ncbi:MAG: proline reductase cluster protein PrdD [Tepidibacter sp.]|jgi:D-proline reductase (dithiol) PrdD|uniref:proline reductase cluster protein PrdD n=1 Tax=Tepidibacter sp. TaxID=2529387 RepID=UPI0025FE79F7|nr:proline reductase cluster protein PrdD [Tepidibacter sp.]MCT4507804.1 proline reductase cluster protein PrdD [Tepidibacter sp.]
MNKEKVLRRLVIKAFHINKVELGDENSISESLLMIDKKISKELVDNEELIEDININIIKPNQHNIYINTIMDIVPISTKVLGKIGEGITHTLTGVYVMITGADSKKKQMHEFGSSEGILKEQLVLDKAGTPSKDDYIIHFDVTLKPDIPYERKLPLSAFRASDEFIQGIRAILKELDGRDSTESHEYLDKIRPDSKKVVIVKQIAGQGAMYDNQLFSDEPSGVLGGKSIIDVGNVPMIISPNEYRDGALRAMT